MDRLEFFVYMNPAYGQYELHLGQRIDGKRWVVKGPLPLVPTKEGEYNEPPIRLNPEDAQQLIDALWSAGIRPSNGEGSVGQIGAMQKHLDDMRAIAAKSLGVQL